MIRYVWNHTSEKQEEISGTQNKELRCRMRQEIKKSLSFKIKEEQRKYHAFCKELRRAKMWIEHGFSRIMKV